MKGRPILLAGSCLAVASAACTLLVDTSDLGNEDVGPAPDGSTDATENSLDGARGDAATGDNDDGPIANTPADRYRAAVLVDNPVSYWRFEDGAAGAATTAKDEMGRNDGTYAGATPAIIGAMDGSRGITIGDGLIVTIGDRFDLVGDAPYALEAWVKANNNTGAIFEKLTRVAGGLPSQGWLLSLQMPTSRFTFECWWNDAARRGTQAFETDVKSRFVHVVVSFSSDAGPRIFIDGVHTDDPQGTYQNPNAQTDTTEILRFGGLDGILDEVAFYDHELSDERITAHLQAAK